MSTSSAAKNSPKPVAKTAVKSVSKSSNPKPKMSTQSSSASLSSEPAGPAPIRYEFTDDSAVEYVHGLFSEDELKGLSESVWKVRLSTMHAFLINIQSTQVKPEAILRYLIKIVAWKESNFQVMTVMINIFSYLADVEKGFDSACAMLISGGLIDKLGDMKVKKVAGNCLDSIVGCSSLELVFSQAYESISNMKSPKLIADSLLWMNLALKDFGIVGLKLKLLVDFCKVQLASAAAPVRANSVSLLVTVREFGRAGKLN